MSGVGKEGRSYAAIGADDLQKLARIARQDREAFFKEHPQWAKLYAHRVLCAALCQGAALHYIEHQTGVNDFDVYTFFWKHSARELPYRRLKSYDFGDSKFGRSSDRPDFVGRRVDCLMRSIECRNEEDAAAAIRRYLVQGKTQTARLLAAKAVVMLEPDCGKILWPE